MRPGFVLLAFLSMAAVLLCVPHASRSASDRTVDFHSLCDRTYQRSDSASVSRDSSEALYARGYARLGWLSVTHVLRRCVASETREEKCEDVGQDLSATQDLLEEAASRGGELVVLKEVDRHVVKATAGTRCTGTQRVRSWSSMVYDHGHYAPGFVENSECFAYEKTLTREARSTSTAILWRHDPELARDQMLMDTVDLAIVLGDTARVWRAINEGLSVNAHDAYGISLVSRAVSASEPRILEYLADRGALLDSRKFHTSPLEEAVYLLDERMVRLLLARGAQVDGRTEQGNTPLMAACLNHLTGIVHLLLEAGADVNARNEKGMTPLIGAVSGCGLDPSETGRNADPSDSAVTDSLGSAPPRAGRTVPYQDPQIVLELLQHGAKEGFLDINSVSAWDYARIQAYLGGQAASFLLNKHQGAWGYLDRAGRWAIKPAYQEASPFSCGRAAVQGWCLDSSTTRFGYIDRAGRPVTPKNFRIAGEFRENLAPASIDGKSLGFIDTSGNFVISPKYEALGPFSEGLAAATVNRKVGYIDRKGVFVIPPRFSEGRDFDSGIALVGFADTAGHTRYAYVDRAGAEVRTPEASRPGFSFAPDGRAFASQGTMTFSQGADGRRMWGVMDREGKVLVPARYRETRPFHEGRAAVQDADGPDSLWGFVDRTGAEVIPRRFAAADRFSEGVAVARMPKGSDFRMELVDRKGQVVLAGDFREVQPLQEGLAMVMESRGLLGRPAVSYVDTTGRAVFRMEALGTWDTSWNGGSSTLNKLREFWEVGIHAGSFSEGLAPVRVEGDVFLNAWATGKASAP